MTLQRNGWKIESFRDNPMFGPSADTLLDMGAKKTSLILDGEYGRVFKCMILHAGIIHYVLNMVVLLILAPALEHHYGSFLIAALFFFSDVFGTILSCIFLPDYQSVGASGGLFGLLGGIFADIFCNWSLLFNKELNGHQEESVKRNFFVLMVLMFELFIHFSIGLLPLVDNFAHIGGILLGFLFGLVMGQHTKLRHLEKKGRCWIFWEHLVKLFSLTLSLSLFSFVVILLLVI